MYLACVCIIYMFDKGAVLLLNVAVVWISPHHDCGAESCRNVIQFYFELQLQCSYIYCKISPISLVKKKIIIIIKADMCDLGSQNMIH